VLTLLAQTHRLCFTYARATCSVSYAPPAYYADRLCERGRSYLRDFFLGTKALRDELGLDDKKKKLEERYRVARLAEYPRPTTVAEMKKSVKSEKEAIEEKLDRKKVLDDLKQDVMAAARDEFYKYVVGKDREKKNPWAEHLRISRTMFWM